MTSLVVLTQLVSSQTCEDFTLGGLSAFVITPANPAPGKPWIAYGPSVSGLPNWTGTGEEKWMFDRYFVAGIAVAGIYSGDLSGNVAQQAGHTLLYNELVNNHSHAPRFCFHARSRGGLISYNWAADNPGEVAAIGGIYSRNQSAQLSRRSDRCGSLWRDCRAAQCGHRTLQLHRKASPFV